VTPFAYATAPSADAAIAHVAHTAGAEFIAGGTDMLQLLQDRVRAPAELIDINGLPLGGIEVRADGVRIGALARMADVAEHPRMRDEFPAVVESLLLSASPQVRTMASIGGNLLQRTRCLYFRDPVTPCNRRTPDSGCSAIEGENRLHAILGVSPACIATYPGDLAVALVALDAQVEISGATGDRTIPVEALHRVPGVAPHVETVLEAGDLVTTVFVPASRCARRSHYLKVRDRTSFEFALASAAVGLDVEDDGLIVQGRVAVGGVATKPWRLRRVEQALVGERLSALVLRVAAEHAAEGAIARPGNAFKIELLKRTVARALLQVGRLA
jgi:xanthine dehydrogenase YagS FAD-binding subunit